MTGFEVVGVVLGAFPLLIEGLRVYRSSVQTLKNIVSAQHCLKRLAATANTEIAILRNTLETLLEGVVDESQISSLVENGKGWTEKELNEKLRSKMGFFAQCFVDGVLIIKEDLDHVIRELKLDDFYGSSPSPIEPFPATRVRWKDIKTVLKKGKLEGPLGCVRWKDVKTVLKKGELEGLLEKISGKNKNLDYIVNHLPRQESTKSLPWDIAERCQFLRQHAINLHDFLRRKLSTPECSCTLQHFASLQLDAFCLDRNSRDPRFSSPFGVASGSNEMKKLKMMISFDPGDGQAMYDWLELIFQPDKVAAQELREIRVQKANLMRDDHLEVLSQDGGRGLLPEADFCVSGTAKTRIQEASPNRSPIQENSRPEKKKSVAFANLTPCRTPVALVTPAAEAMEARATNQITLQITFCQLGKVLSRRSLLPNAVKMLDEPAGFYYLISPSKKMYKSKAIRLIELLQPDTIPICDRLKIALQLGFLVLQLYDTKWLPTLWGTRDILFLKERLDLPGAMDNGSSPCQYGLIQQTMEPCNMQVTRRCTIGKYNETIYSLGKVLVELALEESLEVEWPSDEHLTRVIKRVGPKYAIAVKNCLSRFSSTLDDNKLKNEFYERVLVPLQDHLKSLLPSSEDWEDLKSSGL